MAFLTLLLSTVTAFALGAPKPDCGDFLRRYVLHRESARLVMPFADGEAEISRPFVIKTAAELRRYMEANPDDPWRLELELLPPGYFRERILLRTEIGPTEWREADFGAYVELVKRRAAADPVVARAVLATARGGETGLTDGEALWSVRVFLREALVRRKLTIVAGHVTTLGDVVSAEDLTLFATFPELAVMAPWRVPLQPPPALADPGAVAAVTLPAVKAGVFGNCEFEVAREAGAAGAEDFAVRLRLQPRCHEDGRAMERWFRAQWSVYLDSLKQSPRGETPDAEAGEIEFDARSSARALGFYAFLSARAR